MLASNPVLLIFNWLHPLPTSVQEVPPMDNSKWADLFNRINTHLMRVGEGATHLQARCKIYNIVKSHFVKTSTFAITSTVVLLGVISISSFPSARLVWAVFSKENQLIFDRSSVVSIVAPLKE